MSEMTDASSTYAARLTVDESDQLDRVTSVFRPIWAIPILVIFVLITASGEATMTNEAGQRATEGGMGIAVGLWLATMLMLVFRQRYPRWWFDFARELTRFEGRVAAYVLLLTDQYPSTEDEQAVHLELDYPDAQALDRWLPLVKWLLAIPHYIVLAFLLLGVAGATIIAWFAILFTGRYPHGLFEYVVGVGRWGLRVQAYAFLLLTDEYPPFSLR